MGGVANVGPGRPVSIDARMREGTTPYGSWASPITASAIARASTRLDGVQAAGDALWWLELRPAEGGRVVVVRRSGDGSVTDVLPSGYNARTRVHEYGGGACLIGGETVFFANFSDQRLYRLDVGGDPYPLTPEPDTPGALRYADPTMSPDGRLLICVHERHGEGEPTNELVAVPTDGSDLPRTVASGSDFVSSPRISPDGRHLAWMTWDHPRMPWDGTELWIADLDASGGLRGTRRVAGGPQESIFAPRWSPGGVLHFVSDRSGWWNLYREDGGSISPVCEMDAELGMPHWVFGMSTYAFLPDGRIACTYGRDGIWGLGVIPAQGGRPDPLDTPYVAVSSVQTLGERIACIAGSPFEASAVVLVDTRDGSREVVRRSSAEDVDPGYLSAAEPISFPTEGGETAHAFYYPPRNAGTEGPADERPPLLVLSHGGPTAQTNAALDLRIQYWTSRGFALADVNYRGSTGYGRAYRDRLKGGWGIVDVADCVAVARHLADRGLVSAERTAIRGGSAGGYATLCALVFHDAFAAGANYFGVADLEALAKETHKFESRYLDTLVGPYPERRDLYVERSPVHYAEGVSCPLITFQGLEDEIVPPSQSEQIVEALRAKGLPYAYLAFEGEQHGFRQAENIERSLEAELSFYGQVFGFEPADPIEAVRIENLHH